MAQDRHFNPPFPHATATRYKCTNCGGDILPKEGAAPEAASPLPERCPSCGAPKEAFLLVEED